MLGAFELLLLLVLAPIALLAFAFWVWMLIDAIKNKGLNDTEKLIWIVVIIFTHFLGAVIYFFVGRPKHTLPPVTGPSPT